MKNLLFELPHLMYSLFISVAAYMEKVRSDPNAHLTVLKLEHATLQGTTSFLFYFPNFFCAILNMILPCEHQVSHLLQCKLFYFVNLESFQPFFNFPFYYVAV